MPRASADVKVLGVLDLQLSLDDVDGEVASMKYRVLLVTGVEIALISLLIIFFTRRFLTRPVEKLIEAPTPSARWNWTSRSTW